MKAPKKVDPEGARAVKVPSRIADEPDRDKQNNQATETLAVDSGSASVSSSDSKKVSPEDIELVQNLIERCLQLYMSQGEVVRTLLNRARIDPGFTTLVWQKLEEENADFFRAYRIRLKLKKQIIMFNRLLEHQYHLMKHRAQPTAPMPSMQNGIHQMPANNLPIGYPVMHHQPIAASGQPHLDSMNPEVSMCHVVNGIPAPGNLQQIHGNIANDSGMEHNSKNIPTATKCGAMSVVPDMSSPASVVSSSHFPFTPSEISGMDMDTSMMQTAFSSDVGAGSSKHSLSLEQISWDFNLSDLPADLTQLEDYGPLGNYPGSPFLPSDSDLFLESPEQDEIVNEYFADNIAASPCSQMDEEKS